MPGDDNSDDLSGGSDGTNSASESGGTTDQPVSNSNSSVSQSDRSSSAGPTEKQSKIIKDFDKAKNQARLFKWVSFTVAWIIAFVFFVFLLYLGWLAKGFFETQIEIEKNNIEIKEALINFYKKQSKSPPETKKDSTIVIMLGGDETKKIVAKKAIGNVAGVELGDKLIESMKDDGQRSIMTHYLLMMVIFASVGLSISIIALRFSFQSESQSFESNQSGVTTPSVEVLKAFSEAFNAAFKKL